MSQIPKRLLPKIQEAKEKQLKVLDLSNNLLAKDEEKLTQIPAEVLLQYAERRVLLEELLD